jgi:hypothetical protein
MSDLTDDRQALFAPLRLCALISAVEVTVAGAYLPSWSC